MRRCFPVRRRGLHGHRPLQQGTSLIEFTLAAPLLLFICLVVVQLAQLFQAHSMLGLALFEAARSGSVNHADPAIIKRSFTRAMSGYHGGGRNSAEVAAAHERARRDAPFARLEMLSPGPASFDDFHSPALAEALGVSARVIPNDNLAFLRCPGDRPGCSADPEHNRSGQRLQDANVLRLRVTYGIAPARQLPLAGAFMVGALKHLQAGRLDDFEHMLLAAGRIPLRTHVSLRMHSAAIEAGGGDALTPLPEITGDGGTPELPLCSYHQPGCTTLNSRAGGGSGGDPVEETNSIDDGSTGHCHPLLDPGCEPLPGCRVDAGWLASNAP